MNELNAEGHISRQQHNCIMRFMVEYRGRELAKWEKVCGNEPRHIRAEISVIRHVLGWRH